MQPFAVVPNVLANIRLWGYKEIKESADRPAFAFGRAQKGKPWPVAKVRILPLRNRIRA
jgi:hypothetical protein